MIEALTFLLLTSGVIAFQFRKGEKKLVSLLICLFVIISGVAIKMVYERQGKLSNYYSLLEVNRSNSALDIRQSYKKVSKRLHPDKNPSPQAEEQFQRVKLAYDVLMDDSTRDLYNRFGEHSVESDPRKDELKLLSTIAFTYVRWFVIVYILTIPNATRASRTWIIFVCIGMIILEVMLSLTETSLPAYTPFNLTEYELIEIVHSIFPGIVAFLLTLSHYFYVDVDRQSSLILSYIAAQQKAIDEMLVQLSCMIENHNPNDMTTTATTTTTSAITTGADKSSSSSPSSSHQSIEGMKSHVAELHTRLRTFQAFAVANMELLKNANTNIASKYYWIIFILLYVAVYVSQ